MDDDDEIDPLGLWSRTIGDGEPFVLLHPGGTDSRALDPLVAELGDGYALVLPDQRGHGRTPDAPGPITFEAMAADTAALVESRFDGPVHVFGYSNGAIVALHLAVMRPDLVKSLVFASGVFHRDGWLPGVLDGDAPEFLRDGYAEVSPDGAEHWVVVVAKLAVLHESSPSLTVDDLRAIAMPVLVLLGDDDEVRLDHAVTLYAALPDAELAVIPRSTHGVVVEKPALVASLIADFHSPSKSDGFAPIRRVAED